MEEVWRQGEATVRNVLEALNQGPKKRAHTTILTILTRLDRKGLLRTKKRGRTNLYRPAISRDEYLGARTQTEVDELVDDYGDLALAHFARRLEKLDPARRKQLRRLAEGS